MKKTSRSNTEAHYDVVTIGGGPAGSALTTFLAKQGYRCLIIEQSRFPRYHIGESLVPHTYGILKRLGILPKLKATPYPVKHSVRFVSPDGTSSTPFYFSETIPGDGARTWQVERSTFDQMLLAHAKENGVKVIDSAHVSEVLFDGEQATGVRCTSEQGDSEIHAKVIVDASGRATVIGKQLGLKQDVPGLQKGSLWGYYRGGKRLPGIDAGETTLMLLPGSGWFWYIPLPDDVISVGVVNDPNVLFSDDMTAEAAFASEADRCSELQRRLATATQVGPIRGLRRLAYFNRQTCGQGWVMIGDARAFLDPIYSSGLFLALASAEIAAKAIDRALQSDDFSPQVLGAFEPLLTSGVEAVRALIHAFYDPDFSFHDFLQQYPNQRLHLIDCLVGDVLKDLKPFTQALASMTPPPPPLVPSDTEPQSISA